MSVLNHYTVNLQSEISQLQLFPMSVVSHLSRTSHSLSTWHLLRNHWLFGLKQVFLSNWEHSRKYYFNTSPSNSPSYSLLHNGIAHTKFQTKCSYHYEVFTPCDALGWGFTGNVSCMGLSSTGHLANHCFRKLPLDVRLDARLTEAWRSHRVRWWSGGWWSG